MSKLKKAPVNYDKAQYRELKQINIWFVINTIFTILTGAATIILAILEYTK
jgi:hypothetical protein